MNYTGGGLPGRVTIVSCFIFYYGALWFRNFEIGTVIKIGFVPLLSVTIGHTGDSFCGYQDLDSKVRRQTV